MTESEDLQLHGEWLRVAEIPSTCRLQIIATSPRSESRVDEETLKMYFNSSDKTGIKNSSSLQSIRRHSTDYNDLPVYIATFSKPQGLFVCFCSAFRSLFNRLQ